MKIRTRNNDGTLGSFEDIGDLYIPDPSNLAVIKQRKLSQLDAACNQAIMNGLDYTINGTSYRFFLPLTAQANFTGAKAQFLDGKISEVRWTVLNNTNGKFERVDIDEATFNIIANQVYTFIDDNIRVLRDILEPQVHAATTADEVNSITW